jgi:large subunit ribosomal protein L16
MILQPKRTKYKKNKKNYLSNKIETKSYKLKHGFIGLKSLESTRITARQIEAVRKCVNRELGRKGKVWINIFPHIPVTGKPSENRMGKGKGSIDYWCSPVKIGSVLFEICGVSFAKAKTALLKGSNKLPVKTKIIFKD